MIIGYFNFAIVGIGRLYPGQPPPLLIWEVTSKLRTNANKNYGGQRLEG